jgi:hypothetical protein
MSIKRLKDGRRLVKFMRTNGSLVGQGNDTCGSSFIQNGAMDVLPTNHSLNLEGQVVGEPRLKIVQIKHNHYLDLHITTLLDERKYHFVRSPSKGTESVM